MIGTTPSFTVFSRWLQHSDKPNILFPRHLVNLITIRIVFYVRTYVSIFSNWVAPIYVCFKSKIGLKDDYFHLILAQVPCAEIFVLRLILIQFLVRSFFPLSFLMQRINVNKVGDSLSRLRRVSTKDDTEKPGRPQLLGLAMALMLQVILVHCRTLMSLSAF